MARQPNRRGPNPLAKPGDVTQVRIPHDLRQRAERYARLNSIGSFAAVVRLALERLTGETAGGVVEG